MSKLVRYFYTRLRVAVAALLVFAFIAPSLVQALPSPALTAEQALLRDIATSICAENRGEQREHKDESCQHCILCTAPSLSAARLNAEPTSDLKVGTGDQDAIAAQWSTPQHHPLSRETGPPRGPPKLS
jgi:hypothetical protein